MRKLFSFLGAGAIVVLFLGFGKANAQNQTTIFVNPVHGQANTYLITMKPFSQDVVSMMDNLKVQKNTVFSNITFNEAAKNYTVTLSKTDMTTETLTNYLNYSLKEKAEGMKPKTSNN